MNIDHVTPTFGFAATGIDGSMRQDEQSFI
jgi:hypothetical protein